jgi:drug/metabolite transporter superfamily protein YnfA
VVMVERRYELDLRCYWWFYLISIRHRIYAAYGGIFIISSIIWGIIVDRET